MLSWSSGKDSAWALHLLREGGVYDVVALMTTVDRVSGCVPVHGTRPEVLAAQAESIGLPLVTVPLDWPCANAEYERALVSGLERCRRDYGASYIAFGDLFLEEIRAYQDAFCERIGWRALYPLWGMDTLELAVEMQREGLSAVVSSVNTARLSPELSGREFDSRWVAEVQGSADSCGENGEFHTIVVDSPEFRYLLVLDVIDRERKGNLSMTRYGIGGYRN